MCNFEPKYLEEMEERLDKKIADLLERTRSDVVNEATKTALLGVKDDFTKEVKALREIIQDNTLSSEDMQTIRSIAKAFEGVDALSKIVTGLSKFILSVGIIAGAIIAFVKLGLK